MAPSCIIKSKFPLTMTHVVRSRILFSRVFFLFSSSPTGNFSLFPRKKAKGVVGRIQETGGKKRGVWEEGYKKREGKGEGCGRKDTRNGRGVGGRIQETGGKREECGRKDTRNGREKGRGVGGRIQETGGVWEEGYKKREGKGRSVGGRIQETGGKKCRTRRLIELLSPKGSLDWYAYYMYSYA